MEKLDYRKDHKWLVNKREGLFSLKPGNSTRTYCYNVHMEKAMFVGKMVKKINMASLYLFIMEQCQELM